MLQGETVPTVLNAFVAKLESMETFDEPSILAAIKEVQKEAPAESNAPAQSQSNNQETTQKEEVQTT